MTKEQIALTVIAIPYAVIIGLVVAVYRSIKKSTIRKKW